MKKRERKGRKGRCQIFLALFSEVRVFFLLYLSLPLLFFFLPPVLLPSSSSSPPTLSNPPLTCCCICAICCGFGPPRLPALLLIAFISPPWPLFPTIVARIRMYSPTSSATASGWQPDPWATRQMREGSWRILGLVESSSWCVLVVALWEKGEKKKEGSEKGFFSVAVFFFFFCSREERETREIETHFVRHRVHHRHERLHPQLRHLVLALVEHPRLGHPGEHPEELGHLFSFFEIFSF